MPLYNFRNPKYFCGEILLTAFGKLQLLLPDTHMMPDVKLDLSHANASAPHLLGYGDDFRICHMRGRNTHHRVNSAILGPDKFRENVDVFEGIFKRKMFVESITNLAMCTFHDRTFHFGFPAHLKLYAHVA